MTDRQKFLNLLFEKGEQTCFANSAKGVRVKKFPWGGDLFFSINALHPTKDLAPTESYHRANKPRRADANVISYRNFLIEIDNMPLPEQVQYVKTLLPVSTVVYSGGKSYHFIISLKTPCESYSEYMDIAERIAEYVPKLDPSCKNPSRLSRLPGVMRPDTGKAQKLVFLGDRVEIGTLLEILPAPRYNNKVFGQVSESGTRMVQVLTLEAIRDPENKIGQLGGRNQFFFWLGNRLREVDGWTEDWVAEKVDQAYDRLNNKLDFPLTEAYNAARIRRCQSYNLD